MQKLDEKHHTKVCEQIASFRVFDEFCDVTLMSGARKIQAHKVILATLSDVFTLLLKYGNQNSTSPILLDESLVPPNILENIINYAYTGHVEICSDNVHSLIVAAQYLQLDKVSSSCVTFLVKNINMEDLNHTIYISFLYDMKSLMDSVCLFITDNFYDIREKGLLNSLTVEEFLSVLSNDNLSVLIYDIPANIIEYEILMLVEAYAKANDIQKDDLGLLFWSVNFSMIPLKDVLSFLEQNPRFRSNEEMAAILLYIEYPKSKNVHDAMPEHWKRERSYPLSCRQLSQYLNVAYSRLDDPSIYLKERPYKFVIWIESKRAKHQIRNVSVTYTSGTEILLGGNTSNSHTISKYTFVLERNEVITKIETGLKEHDNGIKFTTNLNNIYGPYGASTNQFVLKPETRRGYFFAFKNTAIHERKISVVWLEIVTPNLDLGNDLFELSQV